MEVVACQMEGTGEAPSWLEHLVQEAWLEGWGRAGQLGSESNPPSVSRLITRQFLFLSKRKQNWISRSVAMKNNLQTPIRKETEGNQDRLNGN